MIERIFAHLDAITLGRQNGNRHTRERKGKRDTRRRGGNASEYAAARQGQREEGEGT
jgi:hypothetical protein